MSNVSLSDADLYTLRTLLDSLEPCAGCGQVHAVVLQGAPVICAERLVGHGFAVRERVQEINCEGYKITTAGLLHLRDQKLDHKLEDEEFEDVDHAYDAMQEDLVGVSDDTIRAADFMDALSSGEEEELFAAAYDNPKFKDVIKAINELEKSVEVEMRRRGAVFTLDPRDRKPTDAPGNIALATMRAPTNSRH